MESEPLVMGIDIGTSGCKTIVINTSGEVVAAALEEYPLYSKRPGWYEQNPKDWWKAVLKTTIQVVKTLGKEKERIKGIGLSGQMHGLVPLEKNGDIIRNSILWNDQRTEKQCKYIHEKAGGIEEFIKITNNPMLAGYTGGKILWMKENEKESFDKIRYFLNPKDYIRFKLTGEFATEVSDASGTGMFDVKERKWAETVFEIIDIPKKWAPKVYESIDQTGYVIEELTKEIGLPDKTPVFGGGGDAVIQTLGTGVISSDILMTTMGTAGIISTILEKYTESPGGKIQVFCNVVPGTWHVMGVTLSAGSSLRWYRDKFAQMEKSVAENLGIDEYEIITQEAEKSSPGAGGVIFLPYLGGERCPYPEAYLRAAYIGMNFNTTRSDIVRSIMEGVIFSFKDVKNIFDEMGLEFDHIRTSGGGAQSELWKKIQADVFQKKVITVNGSREGAAYGAAMVAAVGLKIWKSFDDAVKVLKTEKVTYHDPELSKIYNSQYKIYHSLHDNLEESFRRITELHNI